MYRCVGYYCLENNIDLKDEQAVSQALKQIKIEMDSNNHIFLNGQDVSQVIRQDQVSMSASVVSSYQAVRTFLVEQQRQMANVGGVILDGRDIGTVVLPNAELKIYQIASVDTRAKRRYLENQERGLTADLELIKKDIEQLLVKSSLMYLIRWHLLPVLTVKYRDSYLDNHVFNIFFDQL